MIIKHSSAPGVSPMLPSATQPNSSDSTDRMVPVCTRGSWQMSLSSLPFLKQSFLPSIDTLLPSDRNDRMSHGRRVSEMEWTASGDLQKPAVKWYIPLLITHQCEVNWEWTVQKVHRLKAYLFAPNFPIMRVCGITHPAVAEKFFPC